MNSPVISVVTLTWNSARYIPAMLDSLLSDAQKSDLSIEILFVDNGSTDESLLLLDRYQQLHDFIHVVPLSENRGTTVPRNIALRMARGKYIFILDSDTEIPEGSLLGLLRAAEALPDVGVICPRLIYPSGDFQESARRFPTLKTKAYRLFGMEKLRQEDESVGDVLESKTVPVDFAMSAAWFVPRSVFERVGLLDERIFYAPEDVEFCARVWKSGLKVWYYPEVSIVHNWQRITNKKPISRLGLSHTKGLMRYFWEYDSFLRRPAHNSTSNGTAGASAAQNSSLSGPKPTYPKATFRPPVDLKGTRAAPLRILFITEDDPLYVLKFFEVFLEQYPKEEFAIVGITVDTAFHEPLSKTATRMLKFYGPLDFARMGLRFADARAEGRSIAALAREASVPVLPTRSVNSDEYVARVRALAPDVLVSVAAPEIFKEPLLKVPRLGCINIHSGRLPVYRGMMPNFWQMRHGETSATITVHEMVPEIDAGRILATQDFPLLERDTLDRVISETKREGARLMIDVLRKLRAGTLTPTPVDLSSKKYFSFPKPEDVAAFRARGHRLL